MRISLPLRGYGFALALLLVTAGVLFALALPAGARAAEACPNEQLRQESKINPQTGKPYSTELPGCRAYEIVSPAEKAGDSVQSLIMRTSPAVNGGAVTFASYFGSFANPEGYEAFVPYLATRSASGWITRPAVAATSVLRPAAALIRSLNLYSPDLSREEACGSTAIAKVLSEFQCAARETGGEWAVSTPAYAQAGTEATSTVIGVMGASSDLSHIVFNVSGEHLLPEDTLPKGGKTGLYEISGADTAEATLRLVNVDNNGEEIGTVAPRLGNVLEEAGTEGRSQHAVSDDGGTVYFEATPNGGAQTVYARIDGTYTVDISKPSTADCETCQTSFTTQLPAEFQGASADGSKVFFTTEQELFAGKTGNNLYQYDFDAPVGQRVTLVSRGSANAAVQGVLTSSDDGSHIYFVAQGVLTSAANGQGESAAVGADNLYAFQRDSDHLAGAVSFIARLCTGLHLSGTAIDTRCLGSHTDKLLWSIEAESGRDQATPDGRYLIFDTYAHLLGEDQNEGLAVYRYDSLTGELEWVSHAAPGDTVPNEGDSAFIPPMTITSDVAGAQPDAGNHGRAISEDGSDVVFTTTESLSTRDVNKAPDTYLWHEGTVSLISDGVSPAAQLGLGNNENSAVLSGNGADIYFVTTAKLVGQDVDELGDLYDARLDGGFPAPKTPECAAETTGSERGETCQGTPSHVPAFEAPVSASFMGGSNASAPPTPTVPSSSGVKSKPKAKSLTRTQKLAAALKQCKQMKKKKRRVVCEKDAKRQYGGRVKRSATSKNGRGQ